MLPTQAKKNMAKLQLRPGSCYMPMEEKRQNSIDRKNWLAINEYCRHSGSARLQYPSSGSLIKKVSGAWWWSILPSTTPVYTRSMSFDKLCWSVFAAAWVGSGNTHFAQGHIFATLRHADGCLDWLRIDAECSHIPSKNPTSITPSRSEIISVSDDGRYNSTTMTKTAINWIASIAMTWQRKKNQ